MKPKIPDWLIRKKRKSKKEPSLQDLNEHRPESRATIDPYLEEYKKLQMRSKEAMTRVEKDAEPAQSTEQIQHSFDEVKTIADRLFEDNLIELKAQSHLNNRLDATTTKLENLEILDAPAIMDELLVSLNHSLDRSIEDSRKRGITPSNEDKVLVMRFNPKIDAAANSVQKEMNNLTVKQDRYNELFRNVEKDIENERAVLSPEEEKMRELCKGQRETLVYVRDVLLVDMRKYDKEVKNALVFFWNYYLDHTSKSDEDKQDKKVEVQKLVGKMSKKPADEDYEE